MPRVIPTLLAALALVAGGTLAACGSDDSGSDTATQAPATTPPPTTPADGQSDPASPAPSETTGGATADTTGAVKVSMKNIAFDPEDATVKVGSQVVWTNDDDVDHNVVADSGATFKSEIFGKGGTYAYTPDKAGTISYQCTLHPGMVGTLKVISGP